MRVILAALLVVFCAGCESISYYGQAIGGHLRLMAAARPVDSWLEDPATPSELKARPEGAQRIRAVSSRGLHPSQKGSLPFFPGLQSPLPRFKLFSPPKFSL